MNKVKDNRCKVRRSPRVDQVEIEDPFWTPRQRNVIETVVPYQWKALNDQMEGAEKSHTIQNFKLAAGESEGEYYGMVFQDSDLGKWLETVGYVLSLRPDEQLEKTADEVIDLLGRAQRPDGYLNTYYTVNEPGGRWTDLRDNHEMYCAGHLIEAAVVYFQATGKRRFLAIMCRYADHIIDVFGSDPDQIQGYDGHPEIELALIRLYQVTGEARYLEASKFFVDERGRQPHFFDKELEERARAGRPKAGRDRRPYDYYQAHLPVREQLTAEGHAVRALYLYCAMADLAIHYQDDALLRACRSLWRDVVDKKMYVTGGVGSSAFEERFTIPYDLPNDRAYTETCAAIALVFWAQRMLRIEQKKEYADIMERALYNGVLSGISLDGCRYFYVNPLEVWPAAARFREDMRAVKITRQPWFGCACCPPNIARLLASLGSYIYSIDEDNKELSVHLYVSGSIRFELDGRTVEVRQKSHYPWRGDIAFQVETGIGNKAAFDLSLRVPGWCDTASLAINGEQSEFELQENGYIRIQRIWNHGDSVILSLDLPVKTIYANPEVRENAGKVALQRGPVVYCLEEQDNSDNLPDLVLDTRTPFEVSFREDLLGGVSVLTGRGWRTVRQPNASSPLYLDDRPKREEVPVTAIPYYAWNNRELGEMIVWIRHNQV